MKQLEYFGATETFDPALDFSWVSNLKVGNIIITKNLSDKLMDTLLLDGVMDKCILHLTCTGMGGSILEPNVPDLDYNVNQLRMLLSLGFPIEQVVIRISPIIPTHKGIQTALKVLDAFDEFDIKRIRFSTINMYNHVKDRFRVEGIPNPYESYSCPQYMRDNLIKAMCEYYGVTTNDTWNKDICAEIDLRDMTLSKVACVSQKDVDILGINNKIELIGSGKQRSSCMCPDNKRQIIRRKPGRCSHNCKYCYWKDN